jgi:KamA family protein
VVVPSRIDDACLDWLSKTRLQSVMVLHINHAQEINIELCDSIDRLKQAGVTVLNQSVLLKGVNDSVDTLCDLSEALFKAGVLPYYLHLLDKVEGAEHFDVSEKRALALREGMLSRLPGYLIPKFVREIAGMAAKTSL